MGDDRYLHALLAATAACTAGVLALLGLLFYWFNPAAAGDCSFNLALIVSAALLALVLPAAAMHPRVRLFRLLTSPPACCSSVSIQYSRLKR